MTSPQGVAVIGLVLVVMGCGGGGGGGSLSVPTVPPPPPPPSGPPPSMQTAGDKTLFGEVEGMFNPSASFTGSTVRVVGEAGDTVRTDNSFFIDPVLPGTHVLTVSGASVLNRKVMIDMKAGGPNEIPALDVVEAGPFNLEAFDEIYRTEGESGTARFGKRPQFFIDGSSFDKLPGGAGDRLISEIEMATKGPIRRAVGPLFAGVKVTVRSRLRQYNNPCDLPEEEANWYAERQLEDSQGQPLLGQAWWCWWPTLNRIRGGILRLDDEANAAVILHELVHMLGSADHLMKASGTSIIRSPVFIATLSPMDEQHIAFLYRRPPGLMTPDDARGLGNPGLTSLSSGSGSEVLCNIYPDGRAEIVRGRGGGFVR